jgi:UDP-N-acetylmuramate dehydrogenase
MQKSENVPIKEYTTMGIGGEVAHLVRIKTKEEIPEAVAFAKEKNMPFVVLGEGSNSVFRDATLNAVVLKIEIPGFEIVKENDDSTEIKIGAGENWDKVVERAVEMDLSGIEAMSAIPGTTGATPFQNVGAYGQEIKNVIEEVEVYDVQNSSFAFLSNEECKFDYRDSIFRSSEKGRYIITSIILKLSKFPPTMPHYPGVRKYFESTSPQPSPSQEREQPTLREIRQAIIEIRANKLPDPKLIKNNGSFFKNPIVENAVAEKLKEQFPNITIFPAGESMSKIPAGWLIEQAGLKGKDFGEMKVYENNALVLVNKGNATFQDLENAKDEIIKTVQNKFGVTLEPEPIFV